MSDKEQATRLADWIEACPNSLGADTPKVVALLRRWPDGDPVAYRHLHEDGWEYYDAPTGSDCAGCQALYTAPQSERIAALEAALEQARVALEVASSWLAAVPNAMASGAYGGVLSALRAIEEVR